MRAAILDQSTFELTIKETDLAEVASENVLIKLRAASINHHELWSLKEKNLKRDSAIIMGADGAGIITEVGPGIDASIIGDHVVINPSINWGTNRRWQGSDYEILGYPRNGTFAEYISLPQEFIYKKPDHLSFEEAAAFPLAGLTAYRALFVRGDLEKGNNVLITGIGGGAAVLALQFASCFGSNVYVTSGSNQKITKAQAFGAIDGVNYKNKNWKNTLLELTDGFDVIIDSAAGEGFSQLIELARPGARIVLFGRTAGMITTLNPKLIFSKQLSIHGTTMGQAAEFKAMTDFISTNKIRPIIDSVYPLEKIMIAFKKMEESNQFGKIVLTI